jgi:DUF4097 and DUF4098 domain-containing protein YvlB
MWNVQKAKGKIYKNKIKIKNKMSFNNVLSVFVPFKYYSNVNIVRFNATTNFSYSFHSKKNVQPLSRLRLIFSPLSL